MLSSVVLLLFWCVIPLWGQSFLAPPSYVNSVFVEARNETALTLQWDKVNNIRYILRYSNGIETPLTVSNNNSVLIHTVFGLSPGTKYTFTLYTMLKGVRSSGFNFTAVTMPSNVAHVSIKARSEIAITLEWNKVSNSNAYVYIMRQSNRKDTYTPMYWKGSVVTHTVSSLIPATKYNFTLYTVFGGAWSSGYNFSAVTMPVDVNRVNVTQQYENLVLSWKTESINYSYILRYSNGTEASIKGLDRGSGLKYEVSSLFPGITYKFTLYTVFEEVRSRGLNFSSATASSIVTGLRCEHISGGNALTLIWNAPTGPWTGVEVYMKGRNPRYTNKTRHKFHHLQPALWYDITVKLCSQDVKSAPVSISCQTDPRGVMVGAILAILFVVLLVCFGVCLHYRRSVRKTQAGLQTNHTSVQELEEGPYNASVPPKQQSSTFKKQLGMGSSQQKKVEDFQNPYCTPRIH